MSETRLLSDEEIEELEKRRPPDIKIPQKISIETLESRLRAVGAALCKVGVDVWPVSDGDILITQDALIQLISQYAIKDKWEQAAPIPPSSNAAEARIRELEAAVLKAALHVRPTCGELYAELIALTEHKENQG